MQAPTVHGLSTFLPLTSHHGRETDLEKQEGAFDKRNFDALLSRNFHLRPLERFQLRNLVAKVPVSLNDGWPA